VTLGFSKNYCILKAGLKDGMIFSPLDLNFITMKKTTLVFFSILLSLSTSLFAGIKTPISYSYPTGTDSVVEKGNTLTNKQIADIFDRVNAINQMDKSSLSSAQKLQLKKEMKDDIIVVHRQRARFVYISVGAAIVIIVLLIILL
jgi:hypothetical protein